MGAASAIAILGFHLAGLRAQTVQSVQESDSADRSRSGYPELSTSPADSKTSSASATGKSAPLTANSRLWGVGADELSLPIAGLRPDDLYDTFEDARGSGERSHEALDIMAPRGTPVLAMVDGPVKKLFESKAGGLTVYQFGMDETYSYYYAHLDRYADGLEKGKVLRRGDVLGYVGSTGNASPDAPHLHIAIARLGPEKNWWEGTPVNPYPVLKRLAERQSRSTANTPSAR